MQSKKVRGILTIIAILVFSTFEISLINNTDSGIFLTIDSVTSNAQTDPGQEEEGDLSCADISNCGSSASCNEAGTVTLCRLNCESGSTVQCTKD